MRGCSKGTRAVHSVHPPFFDSSCSLDTSALRLRIVPFSGSTFVVCTSSDPTPLFSKATDTCTSSSHGQFSVCRRILSHAKRKGELTENLTENLSSIIRCPHQNPLAPLRDKTQTHLDSVAAGVAFGRVHYSPTLSDSLEQLSRVLGRKRCRD